MGMLVSPPFGLTWTYQRGMKMYGMGSIFYTIENRGVTSPKLWNRVLVGQYSNRHRFSCSTNVNAVLASISSIDRQKKEQVPIDKQITGKEKPS